MGRKRTISADRILQAAERVVGRDGAAQLTLDAVAEQAGVSKASILYYYGTKKELIEAVVNRGVAEDSALNEAAAASLGNIPNAWIRGRLLVASEPFPDDKRAAALDLCSALAQDSKLRSSVQKAQTTVLEQIKTTSANPRGAMLAYLALEGLKLIEILDFHTWPHAERKQLLLEMHWLVDAIPDTSKVPKAFARSSKSAKPKKPAKRKSKG